MRIIITEFFESAPAYGDFKETKEVTFESDEFFKRAEKWIEDYRKDYNDPDAVSELEGIDCALFGVLEEFYGDDAFETAIKKIKKAVEKGKDRTFKFYVEEHTYTVFCKAVSIDNG